MDKNKHLENVLDSHKMKHIEDDMTKFITKRDEVKKALGEKYHDKKATNPINSGSYAKHTAINIKFDVDLCIPFKHDSFNTLEEMADDIENYFRNEYQDDDLVKYSILRQRVSTGLTFIVDNTEIKMDVVPGRELKKDDYSTTSKLNLHVRAKGLKGATSTQTSIQNHIDLVTGKTEERKIIRLLKIWKCNKPVNIKSFYVELITIKAFEKNNGQIPSGLWGKLKMVLEYIRDNVETVTLVDPSNSNNIVSDTMSDIEKSNLKDKIMRMLERIEENEDNLKIYFSENDKYASTDSTCSGPAILSTKSFS